MVPWPLPRVPIREEVEGVGDPSLVAAGVAEDMSLVEAGVEVELLSLAEEGVGVESRSLVAEEEVEECQLLVAEVVGVE